MSELEIIDVYRHALQGYTIEQLQLKPSEHEWSLGQMYNHLINITVGTQLRAIEECASLGEQQPQASAKTEGGEEIFQLGGFPPVKLKGPNTPEFTPRNPETKEELVAALDQVREKVEAWSSRISDISPIPKVEHRRWGWLNAQEWFRLIGMHYRHHLMQKGELDQRLGL
ncbi:hypothetical protein Back11_50860 [Paenibacillus baekrokdamisoli]|uniref:Uncharacterized protein n=1 Tax=Paenibacillus baekrokdamisoli TaxID=1712516 RepID=A0A3G9JCQ2_9BACL|nr:DinB family protein [Paenibacillus baekrokdamisoli]MBB3068916.1 hypothetical protein [Paenibacillus baekrokdamisoli]BBH23741.1 hypothetical protein Back11_50860 [Paenibacillus baekrokdamisoli]